MKRQLKSSTFKAIDRMPLNKTFSGHDLWKAAKTKPCYVATVLRYLREWRSLNEDFDIIVLSKIKSKYMKVRRTV